MRSREAARLKGVPLRLVLRAVRAGALRKVGTDAKGRLLLDDGDVAAWQPYRAGAPLAELVATWWRARPLVAPAVSVSPDAQAPPSTQGR